jgi:hypothetical protein
VEPATPLCPYRAYREDVQATVATFSTDTHSGTVLLDTGARLALMPTLSIEAVFVFFGLASG